jgi:hypothetical protein
LRYSVGFTVTADIAGAVGMRPARAWTPAHDSDGRVRDGAWIAELTGLLHLAGWPAASHSGFAAIISNWAKQFRARLLPCRSAIHKCCAVRSKEQ